MSTEVAFVIILSSITGLLVIGAFVWFFASDHKRYQEKQAQHQHIIQLYRNKLGKFADVSKDDMNTTIEAQMSAQQKEDWLALQAAKVQYETEEKLSVDIFSQAPLSSKLKQLTKLLGVSALLLIAYGLCSMLDDALGIEPGRRRVPVTFVGAVLMYVAYLILRERIGGRNRQGAVK